MGTSPLSLEQQTRRVLDHLVARESIDTKLDYLLGAIGKPHPKILVDFLGSLVRRERELTTDGEPLSKYDAIPVQFHFANEVLKNVLDYLLHQMKAWYRKDNELFSLFANRLMHSVYQKKFTQELATAFTCLIETGDMENLNFVLKLLEHFEGAEQTRPLYKAIISKAQGDAAILCRVSAGLKATGVVSGEFGMLEIYKERQTALAQWLEDGDEEVRRFAKKQVATFDKLIPLEKREAEEDLELEKRN